MNKENGQIVTGDPDIDFFKQNPELKFHNFGHSLIEKFGEKEAGIIMWAIYLAEDPDSTLYQSHLIQVERRDMIQKTYLNKKGIKNFEWEGVRAIIEGYIRSSMPTKKLRFKLLSDEFNDFLFELRTSEMPMKEKTQVFGNMEKIYKGLDVAESAFKKEKLTATRTSGKEQSGGASSRRNRQKG